MRQFQGIIHQFQNERKIILKNKKHPIVIGWKLINPENIGNIIRIADNFNCEKVIFVKGKNDFNHKNIKRIAPMKIEKELSEKQLLSKIKEYASLNKTMISMIGQGFYSTHTPSVLLRNILENPSWYTAYTPYQPEISQGRLEAL